MSDQSLLTSAPTSWFSRIKSWFAASPPLKTKGSLGFGFDRIGITESGGMRMTRAYAQSVWVHRAIKLVSLPMTEVPLKFSTDARGGKQVVEDPALTAFWESPAIGADGQPMAFADVIEATVGWLKLAGNAFWILDDTALANPATLPFPEAGLSARPFLVARPDRMKPVKDKATGKLMGWEMTDGAGRRHAMGLEQVIHLKLWNPFDDCLGQSELEPAKNPAEADYLASQYEVNLWSNAGDRGPIIGLEDGQMLTDEQREQFVAQLREKKELASRGIFKTVFIDGKIRIEDPKVQAIDSAVIAAKANDATAVAIAFGIPPSMFTVTASYSIGSASDRYRLIEDTSSPTGKKITEGIERIVNRKPGTRNPEPGTRRRLFAWFDWSKHSVFAEVRAGRIDKGAILWDRGVSWETINDFLDLGLREFEGWDERYLPFSLQPADAASAPPENDPRLQEQNVDPGADDEMRSLFKRRGVRQPGTRNPEPGTAAPQCSCGAKAADRQKARNPQEIRLWKFHIASRKPAVQRTQRAINGVLDDFRVEVLRKLKAAKSEISNLKFQITKAAAGDFMFSLSDLRDQLKASLRRAALGNLNEAGQQLFTEVGKDDPFKFPPAKALDFLAKRENRLSGVPDEIFNRVKEGLQEGLDAGDSIDDLAKRVRSDFDEIEKGRARTIAMTETNAAYGAARQEAMEQSGVPFKKWLTSGAANVRPAHQEANGQTVRVDAPFIVDGEPLDGPGDPTGSPGNVINCHCVAIAVANEEGAIEA